MHSVSYKATKQTRTFADENKQNMNLSEIRMWMILKGSSYNFRRQKTLGNYIVDFASLKHKIVIEVDGISHEERKNYDKKREIWITDHGYKILRFVGMMPFPDDSIYEYIWEKIRGLEEGTAFVEEVIMD